jgi:dienelactone hydrolase
MRPLEIVFLLVNAPLLAWCLMGRALPVWIRVIPLIAIQLMVLQVVLEGARWQIVPGYVMTLCLFFACFWPRLGPSRWTAVLSIGLLLTAAGLGTVLPVFELPKLTGPFPIGTVTLHLIASAREETQSDHPGEPRELMIQIWYPAERSGPRQAYRTWAETELKTEHLALVKTHAAPGVPVATALPQYPIVLFSPSWTGRRNQNTVQAEELASQGFVVVGIDHPYSTDLTIFPDGRTAKTTLSEWLDCSTDETLAASIRTAEAQVRIRAEDARFVLDELERLNRFDPQGLFTNRFDISRAGIFGHSFGGAVAAEVCLTDPRFKAGIDLDGYIFGESTRKPISKPFLVLCDVLPNPMLAELETAKGPRLRELTFKTQNDRCILHALSESEGYCLSIRGTGHMNFCDSPLYSPLKCLTHAGPIRPELAMEIIDIYMVSFFQTYLNGKADHLLDAPSSRYPEVKVQRISNDRR